MVTELNKYTPIPEDLLKRLPTRALNFLTREKVQSCENLLNFDETALFNYRGIGKKTVSDIKRLQKKIIQRHPDIDTTSFHAHHKSPNQSDRLVCGSLLPQIDNKTNQSDCQSPKPTLLSHTLLEIFYGAYPEWDCLFDDRQTSIGNLGFIEADLERLSLMFIFADDPADILLHMTIGYLLQTDIDEDGLLKILQYLSRVYGLTDRSQLIISDDVISADPILSDVSSNTIDEIKLLLESRKTTIKNEVTAVLLPDIATLSERTIISQWGFSAQGLNIIYEVLRLKNQTCEKSGILSRAFPVDAYKDFDSLVDKFLGTLVKRERESRILKARLGLLDGCKWTLEEVGLSEKITRERVRQIEEKYTAIIEKPRALGLLRLFWLPVNDILIGGGGACTAQEMAAALAKRFRWQNQPQCEAIASLINLSAQYTVLWGQQVVVMMPNYPCLKCNRIQAKIRETIESRPDGVLPLENAVSQLMHFCESEACCNNALSTIEFSCGFLFLLKDESEGIHIDENAFYTPYAWALKYGKNRILLVETTLQNACRPMHFTEVCTEINNDLAEHEKISERNIYAYIERSPNLLLWDRGTFVHREHISIPFEIIAEIEKDIIRRLKSKIPYLSVSGIYNNYEAKLLAKNVPSESALYSCLRESSNPALLYPEYPYVMLNKNVRRRQPVPLVLEQFVLQQDRIVTLEHIRQYALNQLCVNEAVFMANHLPNIPNLLRVDRGNYIHMRQLNLKKNDLLPVIEHLATLLKSSNHISVIRLFNDKKITCKLLGIATPMLLFSIIQFFYPDEYDLSIYPRIRLCNDKKSSGRALGVADEIIQYLLKKKAPCSFDELYRHFIDDLGYKKNSVHNAFYTHKDLVRYSDSVIVHYDILGWSETHQASLCSLAEQYLSNRGKAGKPFGVVTGFHDYYQDLMPQLPDHLHWTQTLIGEMLSRDGRFRILGSQRNAFVAIPNKYNIETLDDLLYYIISLEYDGAANIHTFIAEMREVGILKNSLSPMMLGLESRVIMDGNVIRLAGL